MNISKLIGILILGLSLVASFYFWQQNSETQKQMRQLMGRQSQTQSRKRGTDPYVKSQVKNTITKNAMSIQHCYKQLLLQKPERTQGKVVMDWQINEKGRVFGAGVIRSDFRNQPFEQCLTSTVRSILFPGPPSGMIKYVEHTFRFKEESRQD